MSIELITGKSATAHISANDFRAINRANYGPGRYILKDADNMQVEIYANGTISISKGSCMWSGMHIRCETPTTLNFTPPVSSSRNIYVYLHYVKDAETLYESVEWVVSVGKELTPIIDNVADTTMEAYTLFCYALMFEDGTTGETHYKFELIKSHKEIEEERAESQKDAVLFDGNLTVGINAISESIKNFRYIVFEIQDEYKNHLIQFSDMIGEDFAISIVGNGKWSNKNSLYVEIYNFRGTFTNDTSMKITYLSRTVADESVISYYGSDGVVIPLRIIGRERINR